MLHENERIGQRSGWAHSLASLGEAPRETFALRAGAAPEQPCIIRIEDIDDRHS